MAKLVLGARRATAAAMRVDFDAFVGRDRRARAVLRALIRRRR